MPAAIGSWFARNLTGSALALAEGGRVVLRSVEDEMVEAIVKEPRGDYRVVVDWGSGTGPQALHASCSCPASGVCEHVVATLEAVRIASASDETEAREPELDWLPAPRLSSRRQRARGVWVVFSTPDGDSLGAQLILDSPRLRGAVRDAPSIVAMMDTTPPDDWDEADRELMREEAVLEAFGSRTAARALARALFAVARHPRLRFDSQTTANRHPSELPEFTIDVRGVALRATRANGTFIPIFETADGSRVPAAAAFVLDGPPAWIATPRAAFITDGTFDARRAVAAARRNGSALPQHGAPPSSHSIVRVAPYLDAAERTTLGIVDAVSPTADIALEWSEGALVATVIYVDRATGARAPYAAIGAVAHTASGFVRFPAEHAIALRARFIDAGFVPRSADKFALHGAPRAAAFVRDALPYWRDLEWRLDDALLELASGAATIDVNVAALRSGEQADWFELRVDVFVGGGQALTERELSALLSSSERFADVRGRLVDVSRLRERNTLLSDLADRKHSGFAALLALRDELHESFDSVNLPPEVEEIREKLRGFKGIPAVEPPALHNGALRHYQEHGLNFLAFLAEFGFGGILADEMGLGKTIQVISALLRRRKREGPAPSLVIAPTSVTHTWQNEIARFAPELKTLRLHSGPDRAARYEEVAGADVVITSYALARIDAEQLAQHNFRMLILDEAQHAKNPASQIARVVRALRAEHRVALTGTPVENSLRDLWSIFAFVEPGLLGSERSFRRRFEVPIQNGDERAVAALHSRLEPFVLRRTKEHVAPELPERTEVVLECDLSELQKRLYRGVAEAARREVFALVDQSGIENATLHVLAALTRLRQICAHPGLLFPEHRSDPEASAKFEAFVETVDEVLSGGHRLLVFSAFASMLKIMREDLDRRSISYGFLDGSTKDRDREGEVARFMSPSGPPLFLCSLKAGGVGLTLTAADYVVLYDPWWNPAVERQAIDRTHRIGQHRAVTAYRLVTAGTVEEKIRALAERKASLSRSVIKADGALAKSLTRADLEGLLADPT